MDQPPGVAEATAQTHEQTSDQATEEAIAQARRNASNDVLAVDEAERAAAQIRTVTVEEAPIPGSRSAEGVDGGNLKTGLWPLRRDHRQLASQTVPGKKQRLSGAAARDRAFNCGLDRAGGLGEPL